MDESRNILYGKKLKKLRLFYQYNQKQCVEPLQLRRQQDLSELEKGRKYFNHQLIVKICEFFKVSYADFTSFKNFDTFPESNTPPLLAAGDQPATDQDVQLQINLLRKRILLSELALINAERVLSRKAKNNTSSGDPDSDIPIYVLV